MTPEVDLAALATGYRHRPPSSASLQRARATGSELPSGSRILDVGGGHGHHASVWADQGHWPIVVDPASEMIRPARERHIAVVLGVSQALPFADGAFDLAWFHLSIHYGDWRTAVDEARRATRSGGRIEIWTLATDHHDTSLLARWFPSVAAIDASRFPDGAELESFLAAKGSSVERSQVIEERMRSAGAWAEAVDAGFVSTLQLLDDAERAEGMEAFRLAHPDPDEEITYELRLDRVVAQR